MNKYCITYRTRGNRTEQKPYLPCLPEVAKFLKNLYENKQFEFISISEEIHIKKINNSEFNIGDKVWWFDFESDPEFSGKLLDNEQLWLCDDEIVRIDDNHYYFSDDFISKSATFIFKSKDEALNGMMEILEIMRSSND